MGPSDVETRTDVLSDRQRSHSEGNPTVALCITGMHRSGTSMVARLLHACGIFLGPEDELSQPVSDNPEGYWENLAFVRLNEEIIAKFDGRWDDPPSFPVGWELGPVADSFLERAEGLVRQFSLDNWGWKDPRNSLTLPFWRRVIPDLKVVVCARNPLEVTRSLFLRSDSMTSSEFQLWLTYYRQLLSDTLPAQRLVTHYQSYFQDARAELRRVLTWLDVEVSDETVDRACAHISVGLRHHHAMTAEVIGANIPDEVLSSYLSLCAEAGSIYQQARKNELAGELDHAKARANEISLLMNELQELRSAYAEKEEVLNEILNSKAFKLASRYWRLRGGK